MSNGLGEILRTARMSKGLTQKQLAKKAGLTNVFISKIEHNVQGINWITLVRLCGILEIKSIPCGTGMKILSFDWNHLEKLLGIFDIKEIPIPNKQWRGK